MSRCPKHGHPHRNVSISVALDVAVLAPIYVNSLMAYRFDVQAAVLHEAVQWIAGVDLKLVILQKPTGLAQAHTEHFAILIYRERRAPIVKYSIHVRTNTLLAAGVHESENE